MKIRSLSTHANYRCGHSGACCNAGWPIPVERGTYEPLRKALANGSLQIPADGGDGGAAASHDEVWTAASADAPLETPVLAAVADVGGCVFYERGRRRCAIHRQMGEAWLPVACRQFPRVSLLDARGLSVGLSHFCPTAAALLFDDRPLVIADMPPAFPPGFPYDPLDARDALPPLLQPRVLLGLPAFDRWEREVVALCAEETRTAEGALAAVEALTEAIRRWQPDREPFDAAMDAALEAARATEHAGGAFEAERAIRDYLLVLGAVPDAFKGIAPPPSSSLAAEADARYVAHSWPAFAGPVRRYLAAKAFGSWLAYQGRGLRTAVSLMRVALSILRLHAATNCTELDRPLDRDTLICAIRRTDELLVHLASQQTLADRLSASERALAARGPLGLL